MLNIEATAGYDLDRTYYGLANYQKVNNFFNQQNIQGSYLDSYNRIIGSDLSPEGKYDSLESLRYIAGEGLSEAGKWRQVGDNPYSFEDMSGMVLPSLRPKGDSVYECE